MEYLTLSEVARSAPGKPTTNCIWRWCRKGVKARTGQRVHLDHVRVGGKVLVPRDAPDRFFKALANADAAHFSRDSAQPSRPPRPDRRTVRGRTALQRQRAIQRAEKRLASAGS